MCALWAAFLFNGLLFDVWLCQLRLMIAFLYHTALTRFEEISTHSRDCLYAATGHSKSTRLSNRTQLGHNLLQCSWQTEVLLRASWVQPVLDRNSFS